MAALGEQRPRFGPQGSRMRRSQSNPAFVQEQADTFTGFLWKHSRTHPSRWMRRHFRFENNYLSYHHSAAVNSPPRFVIHASAIDRVVARGAPASGIGGHVFDIFFKDGSPAIEVAAITKPKMEQCVTVLVRGIASKKDAKETLTVEVAATEAVADRPLSFHSAPPRAVPLLWPFPDVPLDPPASRRKSDAEKGTSKFDGQLPALPKLPSLAELMARVDQAVADIPRTTIDFVADEKNDREPQTGEASEQRGLEEGEAEQTGLKTPVQKSSLKMPTWSNSTGGATAISNAAAKNGGSQENLTGYQPLPGRVLQQFQRSKSITSKPNTKASTTTAPTIATLPSRGGSSTTGQKERRNAALFPSYSTSDLYTPDPMLTSSSGPHPSGPRPSALHSTETLDALMQALRNEPKFVGNPRRYGMLPPRVANLLKDLPPLPKGAEETVKAYKAPVRPVSSVPGTETDFNDNLATIMSDTSTPTTEQTHRHRKSVDSARTIIRPAPIEVAADHTLPTANLSPLSPSRDLLRTPVAESPLATGLDPARTTSPATRQAVLLKVINILRHGDALHERLNQEEEKLMEAVDQFGKGGNATSGKATELAARTKARRKALDEFRIAVEDLGRKTRGYIRKLPLGTGGGDEGAKEDKTLSIASDASISNAAIDLVESVEVTIMKLAQLKEIFGPLM
ncbi:uncharacterized protein EV422DRAFT_527181 [Fimicolochytrium jonesii]|uniref:uncharacterized protein n=1 Tax=Fimicolochytrium jonesii TaxID=1396493 RepID=UPI0022FDBCD7|nr:uncharacterized protein EV422DRAFT_527181 [Fimicolochytrium jonesii]KAI8821831.1 hypothetical protein EV422DRAFT_527181 [Fimicolochytrium jonesii]